MARHSRPPRSKLDPVVLYNQIYNLFYTYLNLSCLYISAEASGIWRPLFFSRRPLMPHYFEHYFNRTANRDRRNVEIFSRAAKEGRIVQGVHAGFWDCVAPVFEKGRCRGYLMSGPFLRKVPSAGELVLQWEMVSGRKSGIHDTDFLTYARVCLETPVLEGTMLGGVKDLLGILGRFLVGKARYEDHSRLEHLRKNVFPKHLSHGFWMGQALGEDKFYPTPWSDGKHPVYLEEEMGMCRVPTTVLAVSFHPSQSGRWSPVESLVRAFELQRESFHLARTMEETVAGRLEDYGALFVTSPSPSKTPTHARLEIRDRATFLRRHLERRFKTGILVGVGASAAGGERLDKSRHQAVTALNLCASLGQPVVFFEDHADKVPGRYFHLRPILRRMLEAYLHGSRTQRESAREEYVLAVLHYASERSEVLRAHLLAAVFDLVEAIRNRLIASPESLDALAATLEGRFQKAVSQRELIEVFKTHLAFLADFAARPSAGGKSLREEQVRRYLEEHYREPITVATTAQALGVSRATLGRICSRKLGKGFNALLQDARLEEAKRLLHNTRLNVLRVAQECGYNSGGYFFRVFKRRIGMTPDAFRGKRPVQE